MKDSTATPEVPAVQAVPVVPAAPVIEVPKGTGKAKEVLTFNAVMHSVKSSSVQSIGFDPVGTIGVTFCTGKTFVYNDCTPELFNQIAQSKSVGSAVPALLKGKQFTEIKLAN